MIWRLLLALLGVKAWAETVANVYGTQFATTWDEDGMVSGL